MNEFEKVIRAIEANPKIKVKNNIGGPGVCCLWRLSDVLQNYNYLQRCVFYPPSIRLWF